MPITLALLCKTISLSSWPNPPTLGSSVNFSPFSIVSPALINNEVPAGRFSVKLSPSSLFKLIICVPSSLVSIEVIVPELVAVNRLLLLFSPVG